MQFNCQNSVTKLLLLSKKETSIKQTIYFPNAFSKLPRSSLRDLNESLYDENTNYLLPHVYANVVTQGAPYKNCDFYGVAISNITHASFDITVRRLDEKKAWDDVLYLDWFAEMFNPFNTCTTVGTNMNANMKECEYKLLFAEPVFENQVGVILQAYAGGSDIQFSTTVRKISDRGVICAVRRTSGKSSEWNIPIKIFCRAFLRQTDVSTVKSGIIDIEPNSHGIYAIQHRLSFPTSFQSNPSQPSPILMQYSVIAGNENENSGIFAVSTKEISNSYFSVILRRIDEEDKWNMPIKLFWIAQTLASPYIPFAGNPPRSYGLNIQNQSIPQQNINNRTSIPQPQQPQHQAFGQLSQQQVYSQPQSFPQSQQQLTQQQFPQQQAFGQPSQQQLSQQQFPQQIPQQQLFQQQFPQQPQQQAFGQQNLLPQNVPPPQPKTISFPQIKDLKDLQFALAQTPEINDKLRLLQGSLFVFKSQVTSTEISSVLQVFPSGKKEAFLLLISTGKVMLTSYDIPVVLQLFTLENEKFEALKNIRINFPNIKFECSDARSSLGQFQLPNTRLEALETVASLIVDAKKNGKMLTVLFEDKEHVKQAKKCLGLLKFGLF